MVLIHLGGGAGGQDLPVLFKKGNLLRNIGLGQKLQVRSSCLYWIHILGEMAGDWPAGNGPTWPLASLE